MTTITLVETIPSDLNLKRSGLHTPHNLTGPALIGLIKDTKETLDLTAMYWSLEANNPIEGACLDSSKTKCCGNNQGCATPLNQCSNECKYRQFFSSQQMKEMGADIGTQLYQALEDALQRGVKVRVVESPGFGGKDEAMTLQTKYPNNLQIRIVNMKAPPEGTAANSWYGGGIMHAKLWLADANSNKGKPTFYIGSANMDWKSLAQVKEMGAIVSANSPDNELVKDFKNMYEMWWAFSDPTLSGYQIQKGVRKAVKTMSISGSGGKLGTPPTTIVYDPSIAAKRQVPVWSELSGTQIPNAAYTIAKKTIQNEIVPNWNSPLKLDLNGENGNAFISGAPDEVIVPNRTKDRVAIVNTIKNADKYVCISVMDFTPTSIYLVSSDGKPLDIWWPDFFDAILYAVFQKGVTVKVLVSLWSTSPHVEGPFLQKLQDMASVCKIAQSDPNWSGAPGFPGKVPCGSVEVRRFIMPGWDKTYSGSEGIPYTNLNPLYPSFSRVNHTKYVVTDKQVNIGTSNWTWGYFFNTAGASLNLTHPSVVDSMKRIFDEDWETYGVPQSPQCPQCPQCPQARFQWYILVLVIVGIVAVALIVVYFLIRRKSSYK